MRCNQVQPNSTNSEQQGGMKFANQISTLLNLCLKKQNDVLYLVLDRGSDLVIHLKTLPNLLFDFQMSLFLGIHILDPHYTCFMICIFKLSGNRNSGNDSCHFSFLI